MLVPPSPKPQRYLGQAVRQLRTERGWTQAVLAERAGMNETYMPQVEGGTRNPSWANVVRLAAALGLKASELAALAEEIEAREG